MLFKEDKTARAEHQAVRENAGWYRWTHDLVEVTGKRGGKVPGSSFRGGHHQDPGGPDQVYHHAQ